MKVKIKSIEELEVEKGIRFKSTGIFADQNIPGFENFINRSMKKYCGKIVDFYEWKPILKTGRIENCQGVWTQWMFHEINNFNRNGANS